MPSTIEEAVGKMVDRLLEPDLAGLAPVDRSVRDVAFLITRDRAVCRTSFSPFFVSFLQKSRLSV